MNNITDKIKDFSEKVKENSTSPFQVFTESEGGVIPAMVALTIGLLFARHHLIFGAHPLGIALISSLPILVWPSLIGVIVGSLSLGEDGIILAACSAIVILIRLFTSKGDTNEKLFGEGLMLKMSAAVISGFVAAVYESIVSGISMTTVFFSISMILIPPILVFVFSGLFPVGMSIKSFSKIERASLSLKGKTDSEKYNLIFFLSSALVTLFLISLSLSDLNIFGIGMNLVFISLATLIAAKKFGAPIAMAVGFISALSVSGIAAVAFALIGLISAIIFPFGTASALFCAGAGAAIWGIYASGMAGLLSIVPEYAISATIIAPIVKNISIKKSENTDKPTKTKSADIAGIFSLSYRNRFSGNLDNLEIALNSTSSVMRGFSKTNEIPSEEECRQIILDAATDSCENCKDLDFCKREDISPARKNVDKLAEKLCSGEKILTEDINTGFEFCSTPDIVAERINTQMSRLLENKYRLSLLSNGADQYDLIGKLISEARGADRRERSQDNRLTEKITSSLVNMGYPSAVARVFGDRRKHFIVAMEDEDGSDITRKEIIQEIEKQSDVRVGAPEFYRKDKCAIMECEVKPGYTAEFSIASYSGGDEVSGDTASVFEINDRLYALCSDGMGSGEEARRTSDFALKFLKTTLGIGNPETTLHLLNSTLRGRGSECSATIDLFILDTLDGSATFIKSGAAPSFVKRDSSIFRIKSTTAPIGLMRSIDAERICVEIKGGDYIIMLSDGVSEIIEESPWLLELLSKPPKETSKAYADFILNEAKKNSKSHDDMSVLVLKIIKN